VFNTTFYSIFSCIVTVIFIGGGNQSRQKKITDLSKIKVSVSYM